MVLKFEMQTTNVNFYPQIIFHLKKYNSIYLKTFWVFIENQQILLFYMSWDNSHYFICVMKMFKFYLRLKKLKSENEHNDQLVVSVFKEDKTIGLRASWKRKHFILQQKLSLYLHWTHHIKLRYKLEERYSNKIC